MIVFAVVLAGREFLSVETFCSSFRTAGIKTVRRYNFTLGGWMTTRLSFLLPAKLKQ